MRIALTPAECKLTHSALNYLTEKLADEYTEYGLMTRWARKEVREQLAALLPKFEVKDDRRTAIHIPTS
jgi:hypothetical protein